MASWKNATITNKGYALQAKLLSTDKLEITRVVSGSGRAIAGQLVNQTSVLDVQQTLILESLSYDDKGNAKLRVLLNNNGLTSSYVCNQIGIYANDPDEGEILYAIAQEASTGHPIPSISEQPNGYDCGWLFTLTFSNSENISVTIDPANALTVEAGDARYLKSSDAKEKYLQSSDAETKYLKQEDAVGAPMGTGAEIFNDYRERETGKYGEIFGNVASGNYAHAEGKATTASGYYAHAEGNSTDAWGGSAHAEGEYTEAGSTAAHAEGNRSVASGAGAHAEGQDTEASSTAAHAEGRDTEASSYWAHAEGAETTASGEASHSEGYKTTAKGMASHAGGYGTIANDYQFVAGKNNIEKTGATDEYDQSSDNSLFIIGYGTPTTKANAMRVTAAGRCMGVSAFLSSGADFAEYFEWLDGNPNNEDRRGRFVTLDGKKIKLANADDDYILGAISVKGAFIGNSASENWHGMYLTDVFGEPLTEQVEVPEKVDEKTGRTIEAHTITRFVVNPEYKPEQEYVGREFRKEYAPVGFHGQIVVVDDGTCQVNSYCKPSVNGIATASDDGFRVMSRLDDTHIEVLIK